MKSFRPNFTIKPFLLVLVICQVNCAFNQASPDLESSIDALFEEWDNMESPGYAIGISKGDKTLFQKGYGSANLDYNIPISPQSSFSIASVSKQFTAACIALLILDGELNLETSASQFVPELKQYKEDIQIKHLIYNTSGITDYRFIPRDNGKSWITFNYFDIDECIEVALSQDQLKFKPGEKWDYCNINFMLLTKIVEMISGQSFRTFARDRLFRPLGMDHTFINDDITEPVKNRVTPYNLRTTGNIQYYAENGVELSSEGKYIQHHRNSPHYGGSGVITTIEDLLKWSKNMVSKDFGGQAFYNLMHKTIKFDHERDNQAFGLYFGDFNGRKIIAWDGGDWGISTQLMRFPDQEVAIIVLSNLGSGGHFAKPML